MANRLADETSPYLRQHADNPVDWYPWGEEAFAAARERDVPVMLSVGYSACHWCHVMAHESFEDPATAAVVNELFVNVKVDREERPDVDAIYMDAVQAMTGHGGWPMTVFLMPDGRPFFGGTYFPKVATGNRVSFTDLCRRIDEVWRTRRDDLVAQAAELTEAIARPTSLTPGDEPPGPEALEAAVVSLRSQHDPEWGGFGRAPKFPQAMSIDLLLRLHARTGDPEALTVATTALDAMASGGIYDHLGGGFARYSVDHRWLVPHFEKMLYDQALLARAYLHAWQVTGEARYRQVLDETVGYVLRDLRRPAGGFASAEDADSEGEEGRFYLWGIDEFRRALAPLGEETVAAAAAWWGVSEQGNFEGANILWRPERGDLLRPPQVEAARRHLFDLRCDRVRPGLDDKVLTEWNALMLSALAEAAAVTGNREWLDAAVANGEFLLTALRRPDGRWMRSWQEGSADRPASARHLGFAADHAALVDAFTRLAEATGQARWIDAATSTAEDLVNLFWDDDNGGVFTTGDDAEELVTRPKDLLDNATPSANSLTAVSFLRLAALTGDSSLQGRAEEVLRLLGGRAEQHPGAFAHLLVGVDLLANGIDEVAVVGDRPDLVDIVRSAYRPGVVLAWGEPYDSTLWENREPGWAYVCRRHTCGAPTESAAELARQLGDT